MRVTHPHEEGDTPRLHRTGALQLATLADPGHPRPAAYPLINGKRVPRGPMSHSSTPVNAKEGLWHLRSVASESEAQGTTWSSDWPLKCVGRGAVLWD